MDIAFVIGCARSGTSILGELLAAHPSVNYIFEAHEVWELAGPGINRSHRLLAHHAGAEVRAQIRAWFESHQNGATLVVEKNPRNVLRIPFLREIFPEAKIIHIVRDGRDVACSLLPGIGGDQWGHLKPPSWERLSADYTGITRCAMAWKEIMEIAIADLTLVPHLEVRYEQLVRAPTQVAGQLLDYLNLPPAPGFWEFCAKIQDVTASSHHAGRQSYWYREDHKARIGRWRDNLDPGQQQAVQELLGPLLGQLGYD